MINVACLYPAPFASILAGTKRTEWRLRKRPDSRLEAIRPGELVRFHECRSTRLLTCIVRAVRRFDRPTGHLYAIRVSAPTLGHSTARHLQGWQRRAAL